MRRLVVCIVQYPKAVCVVFKKEVRLAAEFSICFRVWSKFYLHHVLLPSPHNPVVPSPKTWDVRAGILTFRPPTSFDQRDP